MFRYSLVYDAEADGVCPTHLDHRCGPDPCLNQPALHLTELLAKIGQVRPGNCMVAWSDMLCFRGRPVLSAGRGVSGLVYTTRALTQISHRIILASFSLQSCAILCIYSQSSMGYLIYELSVLAGVIECRDDNWPGNGVIVIASQTQSKPCASRGKCPGRAPETRGRGLGRSCGGNAAGSLTCARYAARLCIYLCHRRLGVFFMIPIKIAFHGAANTNDHIGQGGRDSITKQRNPNQSNTSFTIINLNISGNS